MTQKAVSNRIRELCSKENITVNKLATISGITQSTLSSIMNGDNNTVRLLTIERICKGLNITIYDFFNTEDFKTK